MSDSDPVAGPAGGRGIAAGASASGAVTYDFVVTDMIIDSYGDGDLYDYRIALERGTLTVRDGEALEDVASRYLAGQAAKTRRKTDHIEVIVYPAGQGDEARTVRARYGGYGNTRKEWREPAPLFRVSVEQAASAAAARLEFPAALPAARPATPGHRPPMAPPATPPSPRASP